MLDQLKKLLTCFSQSELAQKAVLFGFTYRERTILPIDFIMSLISALGGDGNATTLAGLHRKFNELPGKERCINYTDLLALNALPANVFQKGDGF